MIPCLVVGRTNADNNCFDGEAGVDLAYINDGANVTDLTFNSDRQVTAITVDATAGNGFKKVEFDDDTAFLNHEKTRAADGRGAITVATTFSFNIEGASTPDSNFLENLNQFKALHAIVKDNNGKFSYVGIDYNPKTDTWKHSKLRTAAGSKNSGANPTNDLAEYVETLTCTSNWYSREYIGEESAIPVT